MRIKWFDSISLIAIMLLGVPSYAYASGEGEVITTVLIVTVVIGVIFLICREMVCWYWKINQRVALLTEIRDLMASNQSSGIDKKYSRSEKNYCPKCNKILKNSVTGICTDCGTTLSTVE